MVQAILPSPIGTILIESDTHFVQSIRIVADGAPVPAETSSNALADEAARQIQAYFAGTLND